VAPDHLRAWLRGREAHVTQVIARGLTRRAGARMQERMHTEPVAPLVEEQFTPRELVPAAAASDRPVASGPSPERRAELLAEKQRLEIVVNSYRTTFGEKSQARGRIREINAELAGNADEKELAAWLKARAAKRMGTFDPALTAAVFRFLASGWGVEAATTTIPYPVAWTEGKWRYVYRRDGIAEQARVVTPDAKGRPDVADPEPGAVYVAAPFQPHDAHYDRVPSPVLVGVPAWAFRAPDGATFTLPDRRGERRRDPISGDAFYKWAYEHGLAAEAARALPAAEAAVPRAATVQEGLDRGTCPVCFGSHALAPKQRHVLDHAYTRPGYGENVQPCAGAEWPAYEASSAGTEAFLRGLHAHREALERWLRELAAGRRADGPLVFTVQVYVLDAHGKRIREEHERRRQLFGEWAVKAEKVGPDDPRWPAVRAQTTRQAEAELREVRRAIPFYEAAVRLWKPGGVPLHEIDAAARAGSA
jgi:hypothetical protein